MDHGAICRILIKQQQDWARTQCCNDCLISVVLDEKARLLLSM